MRQVPVEVLRKALRKEPPDTPLRFDVVTWRQRRWTFYRTKVRDIRLLQIELNEIFEVDPAHELPDDDLITTGELLRQLEGYEPDWMVGFDGCVDGGTLEFVRVSRGGVFEIRQCTPPKYRVGPAVEVVPGISSTYLEPL